MMPFRVTAPGATPIQTGAPLLDASPEVSGSSDGFESPRARVLQMSGSEQAPAQTPSGTQTLAELQARQQRQVVAARRVETLLSQAATLEPALWDESLIVAAAFPSVGPRLREVYMALPRDAQVRLRERAHAQLLLDDTAHRAATAADVWASVLGLPADVRVCEQNAAPIVSQPREQAVAALREANALETAAVGNAPTRSDEHMVLTHAFAPLGGELATAYDALPRREQLAVLERAINRLHVKDDTFLSMSGCMPQRARTSTESETPEVAAARASLVAMIEAAPLENGPDGPMMRLGELLVHVYGAAGAALIPRLEMMSPEERASLQSFVVARYRAQQGQ